MHGMSGAFNNIESNLRCRRVHLLSQIDVSTIEFASDDFGSVAKAWKKPPGVCKLASTNPAETQCQSFGVTGSPTL